MPFKRLLFQAIIFITASPAMAHGLADTLAKNSLLYNGTEYTKQFTVDMGSPFLTGNVLSGSIVYYGVRYSPVDFYYDCQDDVLLIKDINGSFRLQLIKEKLESFAFGNRTFVKLKLQSSRGEFYEQAFKGRRSVLIQWQNSLQRNMQELLRFKLTKTIYLYDGQALRPLQKGSDLYRSLGTFTRKARQWAREEKLSFRKDPIKMIVTIVQKAEAAGW
jgi:hypothetical protein